MTTPQLPADLRQQIARDLRPVRPLLPPWRRALVLAPVAVMLTAFIIARYGLRADLAAVGSAGWGLSSIEAIIGLVFVALALTDAVPGRALPRRVVVLAFFVGPTLVGAITLMTMFISPSYAPPEQVTAFFVYCLEHSLVLGLPAVVVAFALAVRALPLRPLRVGALYGFGAGLFADAGWRLFCSVSAPSHVLLAHGGSIGALTIVGAVSSRWAAAIRSRMSRR